MKQIVLFFLLFISAVSVAEEYKIKSNPIAKTGNKSLHLYNGTIEIVDGGFEVTFFYNGTYQFTITSEDGEVIYSGVLSAIANQPIFIPADVSAEDDEVDELF